mmetsp:Transcript_8022/g.12560  ORF Transcript_8022/g.12560 Transcript_8022/m.12560 type:complete len:160 (-) Transcript_8022:905-1384(-)
MSPSTAYGSIEGGESDAAFDLTDTYYLGEGETSPESRRKRYVSIGITFFVALLIVGGAAYFLSRDFGHLYPGSRGDPHSYNNHYHDNTESNNDDTTPVDPGPSPIPKGYSPSATVTNKSSTSQKPKNQSSSCSVNEKCNKRGLLGDCCPTSKGEFLDCC